MGTKSYTIMSLIVAASIVSGVAIALDVVRSRTAITAVAGTVEPNRWRGLSQSPTTELPRVLRQLDLSDAQRIRVSSIVAQAAAQMRALDLSYRANQDALAVVSPDDRSYAVLLEIAKSYAVAKVQEESDIRTRIYAALTIEQRAQIPLIVSAMPANGAAPVERTDRGISDRKDVAPAAWYERGPQL